MTADPSCDVCGHWHAEGRCPGPRQPVTSAGGPVDDIKAAMMRLLAEQAPVHFPIVLPRQLWEQAVREGLITENSPDWTYSGRTEDRATAKPSQHAMDAARKWLEEPDGDLPRWALADLFNALTDGAKVSQVPTMMIAPGVQRERLDARSALVTKLLVDRDDLAAKIEHLNGVIAARGMLNAGLVAELDAKDRQIHGLRAAAHARDEARIAYIGEADPDLYTNVQTVRALAWGIEGALHGPIDVDEPTVPSFDAVRGAEAAWGAITYSQEENG